MNSSKAKINIPNGWQKKQFDDCVTLPSKLKGLKNSEYQAIGKYPIFDQAKEYISGYTDEESLLNTNFPAILFGDHTRVFKYIKSSFVLGADGTKVFWSKENIDSNFLYYALLNLDIPNTGYNRHFKLLKDSEILIPEKFEQKKIADILSSTDEEIEKLEALILSTESLKISLMKELFTKGVDYKNFKNKGTGNFPDGWSLKKLEDVAKVERGKFSHRPRNAPEFYGGNIPFIQTGDVVNSNGKINSYHQTLNEKGLSVSKLFKKGTIVITIAANIGDTGILEFDSCFPDSLVGITCSDQIDSVFLEYYLRTQKNYLNSISTQSAQKNINLEKLNPLPIVLPTMDEQKKIANILQSVDKKILTGKELKSKLIQLKKGLMSDLLSGKVRTI